MPNAPKIIEELIEIFERDIDNLKSAAYNETQLRSDFVNPFWKALGWDMTNEAGYAIPYRDVKQEFPLKVGLTTKAPDYCFTIAGKPKFFLETKKPSVDVKHEIHPAYQLRRYGWSGKLPLSILTDFEEMAVYDCRIRPKKNDKPSQARIKYYTFREYIDKWDEIESVFSRDAILKGSFDKYVESKKGKRGTSEVDTEFLKEIEKWREALARNIALRNPAIDIRGINFAVQRTIDRIIFLRMCEDRGIEDYSQLQNLCAGTGIYKKLVNVFRNADDKYNSGLFHFKKETGRASIQDTLTPNIRIDDKIIKEILARLYYPESPYEFSFMPAEILGNVYEQFLGKVIRLTKGHQAKVEEKPEVRKAGG
ncbi:type I restriction enzyme HsdR N-terminal domain-containing protein, partial [bacterium]|nr:type I restriction enzyme HsdR N-terminal domain-containing protein [bacterium]